MELTGLSQDTGIVLPLPLLQVHFHLQLSQLLPANTSHESLLPGISGPQLLDLTGEASVMHRGLQLLGIQRVREPASLAKVCGLGDSNLGVMWSRASQNQNHPASRH